MMDDLKIEIEEIGKRIDALRKQLSSTVIKKTLVIKQLAKLTEREKDLEENLNGECERQETLLKFMNTRYPASMKASEYTSVACVEPEDNSDIPLKVEDSESFSSTNSTTDRVISCKSNPNDLVEENTSKESKKPKSRRKKQQTVKNANSGSSSDPNNLQCSTCQKTFFARHHLAAHMRVHAGGHQVVCRTCGMTFMWSAQLKRHERVEHQRIQSKIFICPVCNKDCVSKERYDTHMNKHNDIRPHVCQVCNKKFHGRGSLLLHQKLHSGSRDHVCNICGNSYFTLSGLNAHVSRKHMGQRKTEACDVCGKHVTNIVVHQRVHSGELPLVCMICGKGARSDQALRYHLNTHNENNPHQCNICEKRFHSAILVKSHMRTHTGEKCLKCKVCFERFSSYLKLKAHCVASHNELFDEKLFPCEECGRKCLSLHSLKLHLLSHSIHTPYRCDSCEKCYKHLKDLNAHKSKIHSVAVVR